MTYCFNCMKELKSEGVCPFCGFDRDNSDYVVQPHQLKPGSILRDRYIVGNVIGEGGFGITYVGMDNFFDVKVAIKEFYMNGFVNRNNTHSDKVSAETGEKGELFAANRERFYNEAKVLVKFSKIDGITKVRDFFYENDTAYIVMEFIQGNTLQNILKDKKTLSVEETMHIVIPILKALEVVHEENIIHRDISPDNIIISEDGKPWLIDFGAAREYSEDDYKSLSVILKHGYAPEEQYRRRGVQGPWTDIYALSATIYRCIAGVRPDDALERIVKDDTPKLCSVNPDCPKKLSNVVMKGLAIRSNDRYQSVGEMLNDLKYEEWKEETAEDITEMPDATVLLDQNEIVTEEKKEEKKSGLIWPAIAIILGILIITGIAVSLIGVYRKNLKEKEPTDSDIIEESTQIENTDEIVQSELNTINLKNAHIGDIITFGEYEQDADETNGKEEIEWLILTKDDNKALVISLYTLDCQPYNTDEEDVTWESCSLRKWLNSDFYEEAFDDEEKSLIPAVTIENKDNSFFNTEGGTDTEDRVFCLSVDEALDYFGECQLYSEDNKIGYNKALICAPTPYALKQGVYCRVITEENFKALDSRIPSSEESVLALSDIYPQDVVGMEGTWWWLRTPGDVGKRVCFVGSTGCLGENYYYVVNREYSAVRPAMYIEY